MKKLIDKLNQQVANFGVLYVKLHNFHWFVKGKKFFELHAKFEELYDEVTEHLDAVAERVLMIGGAPLATLKEFLEYATVKEAVGVLPENMVEETMKDFQLVEKEIRETLKIAAELEDEVTVDLLVGVSASLQKHNWMYKAYSNK